MASPVEEIKSRLDIVDIIGGYLRLQKAGINFKALCPFHGEKTASFFVSPERQTWHCFGCGKGGDMFSFLMEMDGLEFSEALRILAQRAGVELKRQDPVVRTEKNRLEEANELAAQFFETQLEKSITGVSANEYLASRGLAPQIKKDFRLGFAPVSSDALLRFLFSRGFSHDEIVRAGLAIKTQRGAVIDRFRGRIMFPITDTHGRVLGFTGRIFGRETSDTEPKYMNTPETPIFDKGKTLYGLNMARTSLRSENAAVLVEGQMDLLMSHQAGVTNAVATSGTALTPAHLKILKRYADVLVIAYDADKAGESATRRGVDLALEEGLLVRVAPVEGGKDPADLVKEDPAAWLDTVQNKTQPIIGFFIDKACARFDAQSVEGKREISALILPLVAKVSNNIEQAHWVQELAQRIGTREENVWDELKRIEVARKPEPQRPQESARKKEPSTRRRQIEEYLTMLFLRTAADRTVPAAWLQQERVSDYFVSPSARAIVETLLVLFDREDVADILAALRNELAHDHMLLLDALMMQSSLMDPALIELEQEVDRCFREIRILDLRERLDALSMELAEVERSGDPERLIALETEFRSVSQELNQVLGS